MTPDDLKNELIRIATDVDESECPSRSRLIRRLSSIISILSAEPITPFLRPDVKTTREDEDQVKASKRKAWHYVCEECKKDKDKIQTDSVVWAKKKPGGSVYCPLCKKPMTSKGEEKQGDLNRLFKDQKQGIVTVSESEDEQEENLPVTPGR